MRNLHFFLFFFSLCALALAAPNEGVDEGTTVENPLHRAMQAQRLATPPSDVALVSSPASTARSVSSASPGSTSASDTSDTDSPPYQPRSLMRPKPVAAPESSRATASRPEADRTLSAEPTRVKSPVPPSRRQRVGFDRTNNAQWLTRVPPPKAPPLSELPPPPPPLPPQARAEKYQDQLLGILKRRKEAGLAMPKDYPLKKGALSSRALQNLRHDAIHEKLEGSRGAHYLTPENYQRAITRHQKQLERDLKTQADNPSLWARIRGKAPRAAEKKEHLKMTKSPLFDHVTENPLRRTRVSMNPVHHSRRGSMSSTGGASGAAEGHSSSFDYYKGRRPSMRK